MAVKATTTTPCSSHPTAELSTPYTASFSVPMYCTSCTNAISSALSPLAGVQSRTFSIRDKLLTITGTSPPSAIIAAIQSTGRSAILRGSGKPNTAAVCILETPPLLQLPTTTNPQPSPIRGLARLIELDEKVTLLDLTVTGMQPGRYQASVRATGDISRGIESVGRIWGGLEGDRAGTLGDMVVSGEGKAGFIGELSGWRVWEMVGRGFVVEKVEEDLGENSDAMREGGGECGDRVVLGVVARSAGVWENEKVVCSCSGKTVWEERKEMVEKGMA